MSTAIVTDTNGGIYAAEGEKLGISVVPMPVISGETTYYEGTTITHDAFFDLLKTGEVHTSQPSPAEVTGSWDRVLEKYDDLVYIPMSSGLSSSFQTARLMAEDYDGRVQVADNHRISVTMRHSVMDALAMVKKGMNAEQIRKELERTAFDSTVFLGVETLQYLKKGGRVTPAAAAIGTILNIKPLLIIKGEKLDQFATVRGTKNCRKKEVEEIRKAADSLLQKGMKIRVTAAGSFTDEAQAELWRAQIAEAFPEETVGYDPLSYSISVHTGPDAFGVGVSLRYE